MHPPASTAKVPQLNLKLPPEQIDKLKELLPIGTKQPVFTTLVAELITLLEGPNGKAYLGAFIKGNLSLQDIMVMNRMGEAYGDGAPSEGV